MAKVLIIDDEVHIRKLIRYLVHWNKLDLDLVGEYDNAEDAIEFYKTCQIDIVITDIIMPGINGLDMIKQMQEFNDQCNFILISGYRDFDFAQKAVKLGVSDYIVKPINEDEVNAVLYAIVNGRNEKGKENSKTTKSRKKFLDAINKSTNSFTVEYVKEKYALDFQQDGIYRILHLGFCNCSEEVENRSRSRTNLF